jgi:hypothetical protein
MLTTANMIQITAVHTMSGTSQSPTEGLCLLNHKQPGKAEEDSWPLWVLAGRMVFSLATGTVFMRSA